MKFFWLLQPTNDPIANDMVTFFVSVSSSQINSDIISQICAPLAASLRENIPIMSLGKNIK